VVGLGKATTDSFVPEAHTEETSHDESNATQA